MSHHEKETIASIREAGLMDCAGKTCTYCRRQTGDCRPAPVKGRTFIPALCDDCYVAVRKAGRFDRDRDKEVFYPNVTA
jgi:hypothetical protein